MKQWLIALSMVLSNLVPAYSLERVRPFERIPAENREYPYDARLPACEDTSVTGLISSRFAQREQNYWNNTLTMVDVTHIRTVAFRPNGSDLIPRRYCHATVLFSDHKKRGVDYIIVEDASIIGWTWGVEWCVAGLERHLSYDGRCRAARP